MKYWILICFIALTTVSGCRGYRSEDPPAHLNPNMDFQAKFKDQSLPLPPPDHVVAWGENATYGTRSDREKYLHENSVVYKGKNSGGAFVTKIPLSVNEDLLDRGQERFNIYCATCHDRSGSGKGMVVARGFLPPTDFTDERLLKVEDGYLFDVMTNGIRNMPSYAKQISVEDRWAIVAYVRTLQQARSTK